MCYDLLCIDLKVTPGTLHAIGGTFYTPYVGETQFASNATMTSASTERAILDDLVGLGRSLGRRDSLFMAAPVQ